MKRIKINRYGYSELIGIQNSNERDFYNISALFDHNLQIFEIRNIILSTLLEYIKEDSGISNISIRLYANKKIK